MTDTNTKWYCLKVISTKERKIKERIDLELDREGWREIVPQIVVPMEKKYRIRNGKKIIQETSMLPGYILVEAVPHKFGPDIVQSIQGLQNVISFLKDQSGNPIPMRDAEANRILGKADESREAGESLADPFIVNEEVKVINGPFEGFVGTIEEVNEEKKKLKLIVKVFGRGTEVELDFTDVEKQS